MNRPRVLLADDHAMLLDALTSLLSSRCEVVAQVHDGVSLVEQARRLRPDIVVSDIIMPGSNGLDAARQLVEDLPDMRVVFLTMNDDPDIAAEALRLGAKGYVIKSAAATELFQAIEAALDGSTYVSSAIVGDTLARLSQATQPSGKSQKLTPRQIEVLRHLAAGHSMKEVASLLHIAPRTVAFHKYKIMEVLGIETNAELIRYAIDNDLVPR